MNIRSVKTKYHKFAFEFEYNPEHVQFCRLLKDSFGWQEFAWHDEKKVWVFSKPEVLEELVKRFPNVAIEPSVSQTIADTVDAAVEKANVARDVEVIKNSTDSAIEIPNLKGEMYPYQKLGVEFLVRNNGNALLADTQGLGKSIQYIGYLLVKDIPRALVVCPASMKYTWEAEVKKWSDRKPYVIESKTDIKEIPEEYDTWIINYDILVKHVKGLLEANIKAMAFDEAHYLKNPKAKRTKAAMLLAKHVPSVTQLTGTPVLSRPVELYTLLRMLSPGEWANYMQYAVRYCGGTYGRFGFEANGATNIEELKSKMSRYFMRRTKEEVLPNLPPKVFIPTPIEMSATYTAQYRKASSNLLSYLKENKGKKDAEARRAMQAEKLVQLNILREITAMGKVDAAVELIENIIEAGEKVIVFSCFKGPLEALREKFFTNSVMLTGDTPLEERAEMVKEFQNYSQTNVFLGGIKSAGVGLTLTAAANVIFLDYSWTPADHMQAQDRAHRIGSNHSSINIYQMYARGTIDAFMRDLINDKQKVFDQLIEKEQDLVVASTASQSIVKDVLAMLGDEDDSIY